MALQPNNPMLGEGPDQDFGLIEPLCAVFRRSLKDEGLKYTPERAQILDTIIALDGLFEAEQLLEQLKSKGFRVSKATVYRTLKLLEDAGIVQRVLFDRDQSHYQLAYGNAGNTLLVRVDTGEVEVLELPELVALRDKICKARGLKPEGHRLQIFATKV
ncbi:MAG: Fur family transcriptional regulator [Phycisphaerales bacterium]